MQPRITTAYILCVYMYYTSGVSHNIWGHDFWPFYLILLCEIPQISLSLQVENDLEFIIKDFVFKSVLNPFWSFV